jgi:hypothetical protein
MRLNAPTSFWHTGLEIISVGMNCIRQQVTGAFVLLIGRIQHRMRNFLLPSVKHQIYWPILAANASRNAKVQSVSLWVGVVVLGNLVAFIALGPWSLTGGL